MGIFKKSPPVFDSVTYWKNRYRNGGNSGSGSYGKLAEFKANSFNRFVEENDISSCIEYGCGDGNQLSLMKIDKYLGLDVSPDTIEAIAKKFEGDFGKEFETYDPIKFEIFDRYTADISISMDVILHLIEESRYLDYLRNLFNSSNRFVGIFNTATDEQPAKMAIHNRFRDHRKWITKHATDFQPIACDLTPGNLGYPSDTGFYYYKKM
jgi:SAM-dependent methyltransferase